MTEFFKVRQVQKDRETETAKSKIRTARTGALNWTGNRYGPPLSPHMVIDTTEATNVDAWVFVKTRLFATIVVF